MNEKLARNKAVIMHGLLELLVSNIRVFFRYISGDSVSLTIIDILVWIVTCGSFSVRSRISDGIPGLCPLDASHTSPPSPPPAPRLDNQKVSRCCQTPEGQKSSPAVNHFVGERARKSLVMPITGFSLTNTVLFSNSHSIITMYHRTSARIIFPSHITYKNN